jgi:signal transduction histidine kinase
VYQGQVVGQLEIRLDSGDALTTGSRRTLADVSRQLAAVVHARSLAQDLQRSQEALVRAREEERRRLRHDLHDGLGPTLAGMALQVERSRRLAAEDPAEADRVLEQLAGEIRRAVGDVRTIAQGLGVAELEDHGLEGALRRMADQFTVGGLPVQVDVEVRDGQLEGLPAAVEVAVYRIVGEALANAARHANAGRCTATVRALDHRLDVTVVDDGVGIPDTVQPGVGLRSMEQRAVEVGGTLVVSSGAGESTTVRASIPLPDDGS